jgi:hypothetical protein
LGSHQRAARASNLAISAPSAVASAKVMPFLALIRCDGLRATRPPGICPAPLAGATAGPSFSAPPRENSLLWPVLS